MGNNITLGNNIYLTPVSLHTMELTSTGKPIEVEYLDDEIVSLKLSDTFTLDRYFPISINAGKDMFIIRYFEKIDDYRYKLMRDKVSISTMFILPLLLEYKNVGPIIDNILNLYSFREDTLDSGELYLVVKYTNTPTFLKYENIIGNLPVCKGIIDIDPYFISFVMKVPLEYTEDVQLIQRGKYSSISRAAKNKIYDYYTDLLKLSSKEKLQKLKIYKILEKEEDYRKILEEKYGVSIPFDVDLYEHFNDARETFLNCMQVDTKEIVDAIQ